MIYKQIIYIHTSFSRALNCAAVIGKQNVRRTCLNCAFGILLVDLRSKFLQACNKNDSYKQDMRKIYKILYDYYSRSSFPKSLNPDSCKYINEPFYSTLFKPKR